MSRLKQLSNEVQRRSLWLPLIIYPGVSWAVPEAVDHVVERYFLPEWVSGAAVILFLIGLPIIMATAFVRVRQMRVCLSPPSGLEAPPSCMLPCALPPRGFSG